ncbi:MAG: trehalose 6-phosphate synthase [Spirochaetota bacterium]
MQTLSDFYDLMAKTVTVRRMLVEFYLAGTVKLEEIAALRNACKALEELCDDEGNYEFLTKPGGKRISIPLDYEVEELEKDIFFFEHGESAFFRYTADRLPQLEQHMAAIKDLLRPAGGATFITDRDGTVNNYCGRYRSSVQSAYNAIHLTRFARARAGAALILTSAPLEDFGLVNLSVLPENTFMMAGSKGREFRDAGGARHTLPIEPAKEELLERFNNRLSQLLQSPDYEEFSVIGSAVQFKFGQTTVARQDMHGSIPSQRSEEFLERVRALVAELDPTGDTLRIEDTGYDIEIILTREQGDRDFNKGDGVAFVDQVAGLELGGRTVVCGDTSSDLPMVREAAAKSDDVRVVFVTQDENLKREVEQHAPQSVFVDYPDALVLALGELAKE